MNISTSLIIVQSIIYLNAMVYPKKSYKEDNSLSKKKI